MRVKIEKSCAEGVIAAPPSKSLSHRMIISAAMAKGKSVIHNLSLCADCVATIDCLEALGVKTELSGNTLTVYGKDLRDAMPTRELYCNESGSTLRFLIPLGLLSGKETYFGGKERLIERPHGVYEEICRERGMLFERTDSGIRVCGPLSGGEFRIQGNVSSQFITGLLYALSALPEDSRIIITTDIESKSYIDLTIEAMSIFGVKVTWESDRVLFIKGNQEYVPSEVTVEGDYSGAAFTDAFNTIGGRVTVTGLNENSLQGDKAYKRIYPLLIAGSPTVSIKDCPDLGPIFFAVAAEKNGATFTDTARLRIKESDRAAAMAEELRKLGAEIEIYENKVVIKKRALHPPTDIILGHNDHRIVMSLTVLLSLYGGEIDGAEAIGKSYGEFFEDIKKIGIRVTTYEA